MSDIKQAQALTHAFMGTAKESGCTFEVAEVAVIATLANLVVTRADGDPEAAKDTMARYSTMLGSAVASGFMAPPDPHAGWDLPPSDGEAAH